MALEIEVLPKEHVNITESKSSSDTFAALSIIHLIRFFDSHEAKLDTSTKVASTEDLNGRLELGTPISSAKNSEEGQKEEEDISNNLEQAAEPEPTVPETLPEIPAPVNPVSETAEAPQNPDYHPPNRPHLELKEDLSEFCENFRPREPRVGVYFPVNEATGVKRHRSASFSLNALHAKRWMRRSASLLFPDKSRERKLAIESSEKPKAPSSIQWSHTVHPLAKRVSSLFFQRKQTPETKLEDLVFLPKTHRPLPQDFPTVSDVEDIADARAEYSVLPDEWSGYLDPMLKSSGASTKPKRGWDRWFSRPVKLRALQNKIKSSFASGKRRTLTLKVRFFSPAAKPSGNEPTVGEMAKVFSPLPNEA